MEEKLFIDELSKLDEDELTLWIRQHETSISYKPQSPFGVAGDPMDVLARTLGLINQNNFNFDLQEKFENAMVEVFEEDIKHPYINPGIIYKFIFIFVNIPPKGTARKRLTRILIPILSQRILKGVPIGSRDLHYDALQLLVEIQNTNESSFLQNKGISDYLFNNLIDEASPRFCNISLSYFKDSRQVELFFQSFDQSFVLLPKEEINNLVDLVISFYDEDTSISWAHLASWLSIKQFDGQFDEKLKQFCNNEKLFRFILNKWEQNVRKYHQASWVEGKFVVALIIILTSQGNSSRLSPSLIELFFQHGESKETQHKLLGLLRQLTNGHFEDIRRVLQNNNYWGNPAYEIVYVGVLVNLVKVSTGSLGNFNIDAISAPQVYIDIDKNIHSRIKIENLNGQLDAIYRWPGDQKRLASVQVNNLAPTVAWWDVLEQGLIFINC